MNITMRQFDTFKSQFFIEIMIHVLAALGFFYPDFNYLQVWLSPWRNMQNKLFSLQQNESNNNESKELDK